jgi:hypothetical protein
MARYADFAPAHKDYVTVRIEGVRYTRVCKEYPDCWFDVDLKLIHPDAPLTIKITIPTNALQEYVVYGEDGQPDGIDIDSVWHTLPQLQPYRRSK